MRRSFRKHARPLSAAVLSLAVFGCFGGFDYGETGTVAGRLTMDGKPLPAGHNVSFMDMEKGYLAFGTTDADGRFKVESWNEGNMPIGSYKVMIAPPADAKAAEVENLPSDQRFDHPDLGKPAGGAAFPRKYANTSTSGLEFEVKGGENNFDIDLKSK